MLTAAALLVPVASSSAETVTTLTDSGPGSLRAAIASTPPGGTVDFEPGLAGRIELGSTLEIDKDLRIDGPGARDLAISGMGATRVLHVFGAGNEVDIDDVTIRDGVTPDDDPFGGGVLVTGGDGLRLTRVAVLDNTAQGTSSVPFGGGIAIVAGELELVASTVAGNRAEGGGGGGLVVGVPFDIVNSTVAGNGSFGAAGLLALHGTGTVRHSTFAGNTAVQVGHAIGASVDGGVTVTGSMLAENGPAAQPLCDGPVADGGGNVLDAACFGAGDVVGAAPLGELTDNGGPTDTMLPLPGNPARDRVAGPCPAGDQRGIVRPQGSACDAGAVEVEVAAPVDPGPVAPPPTPPSNATAPAPQASATTALLGVSRAKAGGQFSVRLRCETVGAARCEGVVTVKLGSRRLSRAFTIAAGREVVVRLRLARPDRRRLAKRRSLRSALTLVTAQPDGTKRTTHQGAIQLRRR